MAQLGYTWYPKDWFISNTRKRLKKYPLVRYAIRELFDLMYIESGPIEMNRDYLYDDLDIELNDLEYSKLMEYIEVQPDGRWWNSTINLGLINKSRLSDIDRVYWGYLREIIFERDNYKCQYCGDNKCLELDHVIPFSISKDERIQNLTTACRLCNRRKKDKTPEEFYNWLISKNLPVNNFKITLN